MLSGGKLIDEGRYGCVFTPPLECKDKKKQKIIEDDDLSYSKLIFKDAAQFEMTISKLITQIPLWKNYFVVSESICEPAPIQKDKQIYDCSPAGPYLDKLSQFRILSMPYGGTPLLTHRFDITTFDFSGFIKHFIEGVALLNLFGIVHRDLHAKNILIDKSDVPRIIDFNLAIPVDSTITSSKIKHQYDFNIGQEPPDSTLVNAILYGYNPQTVIESIIYKKTIIKKITAVLQISQADMFEELESFYNRSSAVKAGDDVKWFKTYWRTIDSWAVGANLIDLISKWALYPAFTPVLRKLYPKLFPVLRRLCAVSPLNRIDCVQALNYLDPNSYIIRKYGKAWLSKVGTGNISS